MTTATLPAPAAASGSAPDVRSASATASHSIPPFPVYRISVQQYHQMVDAGILTTEDRIELIDGWMVPKMGKNAAHIFATLALRRSLEALKIASVFINSQDPVSLTDSEPEPDGMAVRGMPDNYKRRLPNSADVPFIAEVSESTLEFDRTYKKQVYAEARIPVYWIVNLVDRQVEVYTDPTGPGRSPTYKKLDTYAPGQSVPVVIDGVQLGEIPVNDLLP